MKPSFPILYTNGIWVDLIVTEEELSHFSLKSVLNWTNPLKLPRDFAFVSAGKHWILTPEVKASKRTFWQRLLAYTFYNPVVQVRITWVDLDTYDFQELKDKVVSSIGFDDDVLTQFVEAEELIERVNETHNVYQLIEVIDKNIINGDEVTNR